VLVVNKVDDQTFEAQAYEAMRLGFGEPVMVSAENGYQFGALQDAIQRHINFTRFDAAEAPRDEGVKIALVGKRNAGKSTMVNAIAGAERVIVNEQEGTTRDSVDVRLVVESRVFTLIDTAGVRKRKSIKGDVEYYATHRALRSVRRANVCLLLIDATVPLSQVDRQLVNEILKHHRPTAIVVNKWDLAADKVELKDKDSTAQDVYAAYLDKELKGLSFAPITFTSALEGEGMRELLALSLNLYEQARHRVGTGDLNRAVEQIAAARQPPAKRGKQARIYYATQVGVDPPTIVLFVNQPELFDGPYQRYLLNRMRDDLPFSEVPIKLVVRGKEPSDGEKYG
jgi:GTP-binding protein